MLVHNKQLRIFLVRRSNAWLVSFFSCASNGCVQIVFAVSYYFDKADYANEQHLDFDPDMYVAGGVVCWNMETQDWTWTVHLDLTTAKSKCVRVHCRD